MNKRKIASIVIPATKQEKAQGFYSQVFGWVFEPIRGGDALIFTSGNVKGAVIPANANLEIGRFSIAIQSDDIDADLEAIEHHGGKIIQPKTETPVSWQAVFSDPSGNSIALLKLKESK